VVVAVFSLVSLVWETDYFVDFLEIEFFGLLLALWLLLKRASLQIVRMHNLSALQLLRMHAGLAIVYICMLHNFISRFRPR
jgi:hypothetical protein